MIETKQLPSIFVQALLIATASVLALVLVSKFVAPIPLSISQVTTQKTAAFSANGESIVTTIPDKVTINIGISHKNTTIKATQARANEIIDTITKKLGEMGVSKDDVKTQNYSINPQYDYQRATQDIVGYTVDVSLQISLSDFEKLNQVIDMATAAGANQIGGIQFTLSDEKERQVRAEARAKAIDDAKANANELARLSGVKLGKVINVVEGTQNDPPYPVMYADKAAGMGGGGGTPTSVQPGSTSYTYTVTLSYETL